jgi:hypothetical protein
MPATRPAEVRFWERVEKAEGDGCWNWIGTKDRVFEYAPRAQRRRQLAYLFSYELVYGPVQDGYRVVQTCGNTFCVRPDHLKQQSKEDYAREKLRNKVTQSIQEQFMDKVNKQENGCWFWKAGLNQETGVFYYVTPDGTRNVCRAHRFSYEMHYGPIPDNGEIAQTCGIRHCVNPSHLLLQNESLESRFWAKVQKQDGDQCWLWTASVDEHGYGEINVNGTKRAHRIAYELTYGPIPEGLFACHKCDNPQCVRPDHLFLGTMKDNMRDCANKGRVRIPRFLGETVPNAKFKNDEVREIKRLLKEGWAAEEIMKQFPKANKQDIFEIRIERRWKHVS